MKHSKSVLAGALIFAIAMPSMAEAAVRIKAAYALAGEAEQESDFPWVQTGDYTPATLGLSYIAESGFFADISYSTSSDSTEFSEPGFSNTGDYERTDTTASLGAVIDSWGFYMGLRQAEGESIYSGGQGTLRSEGLVFGGSKAFALNDRNVISLMAGMGLLTGEFESPGDPVLEADFTFGYSLGASYAFKVNSMLTLGLEYKWQQYEFDFTTATAAAEQLTETLSSTAAFASVSF